MRSTTRARSAARLPSDGRITGTSGKSSAMSLVSAASADSSYTRRAVVGSSAGSLSTRAVATSGSSQRKSERTLWTSISLTVTS